MTCNIEAIIFNSLADARAVYMPGIGSLIPVRIAAWKDFTHGVLTPPRYIIEYCSQCRGEFITNIISTECNIEIAQAQNQYDEWIGFIKQSSPIHIEYVGNIFVDSCMVSFVADNELIHAINPAEQYHGPRIIESVNESVNVSAVADVNPIVVPVVKPKNKKEERHAKAIKNETLFLFTSIASFMVIAVMMIWWWSSKADNNQTIEKEVIPLIKADTTVLIDVVEADSIEEDVVLEYITPYHIIAGAFVNKDLAEKKKDMLINNYKFADTFIFFNQKLEYHMISIMQFDDREAAQKELNKILNNGNYDGEFEYWVYQMP